MNELFPNKKNILREKENKEDITNYVLGLLWRILREIKHNKTLFETWYILEFGHSPYKLSILNLCSVSLTFLKNIYIFAPSSSLIQMELG